MIEKVPGGRGDTKFRVLKNATCERAFAACLGIQESRINLFRKRWLLVRRRVRGCGAG